jgi:hypothetical protein
MKAVHPLHKQPEVGLPPRPFLYTLDQIAVLTDLSVETLTTQYLHFEGRSINRPKLGMMIARNIAQPDKDPDWRVVEAEFKRWMKHKGFRFYDRSFATS